METQYSIYLRKLFKQYCESLGLNVPYYNDQYGDEFVYWLDELLSSTEKYGDFISYFFNNIEINKVEFNKGKYDSILLPNTTIISPYGSTVNEFDRKFIVSNGHPFVARDEDIYSVLNMDLFVTQNPFNVYDAVMSKELHDNGYNICFGVYGKNYDKDKDSKLQLIHQMCDDDIKFEYETLSDSYFACALSYRKVKKLVKTKR